MRRVRTTVGIAAVALAAGLLAGACSDEVDGDSAPSDLTVQGELAEPVELRPVLGESMCDQGELKIGRAHV